MVAGCASPWLMRLHGQLVDQTERYRMIRLQRLSQQKPAARDVHAEHRALMDAVLARDEAQAVARQHDKGRDAALVAVEMARLMERLL